MTSTPFAAAAGDWWLQDDEWPGGDASYPDSAPADVLDERDSVASDEGYGLTDSELLDIRGAVSEWDLPLLASIDPRTLDRDAQVRYLALVEKVEALVAASKARAVVALAGAVASPASMTDRHAAMEVAHARRVGEGAAAGHIATARALHNDFPEFLGALARGEISEWHCRELVSGTRHVTDREVLAALQERLLPKALRKTPGDFRADVRKAVADLDAAKAAERMARARDGRYVTYRALDDGLGFLGVVTDQSTAHAMYRAVCDDGRALQLERGGASAARAGDDDALADACRADALAGRVLGKVQEDGSLVWDRSEQPVVLTVVMDLDTLRGEADRVALLDGEPIPAVVAREYAEVAEKWRRAVTDPVTGHLLDYGTSQYLPDTLRDFVLARDHCRVPGCTTQAMSRLQMDHARPYPNGETSAANCGGLCRAHHQLKTDRKADLVDSAADGSATWVTGWGQRIRITPRPFLHDPGDHSAPRPDPAAAPPADDPPLF
jgi:hypothetical protein